MTLTELDIPGLVDMRAATTKGAPRMNIQININGQTVANVNVNSPITVEACTKVSEEFIAVMGDALELLPPGEQRAELAQRYAGALTSFMKLFGITDEQIAAARAEADAAEEGVPCSNS